MPDMTVKTIFLRFMGGEEFWTVKFWGKLTEYSAAKSSQSLRAWSNSSFILSILKSSVYFKSILVSSPEREITEVETKTSTYSRNFA